MLSFFWSALLSYLLSKKNVTLYVSTFNSIVTTAKYFQLKSTPILCLQNNYPFPDIILHPCPSSFLPSCPPISDLCLCHCHPLKQISVFSVMRNLKSDSCLLISWLQSVWEASVSFWKLKLYNPNSLLCTFL